ncbi:MAG: sugar kinase, partial [Planctomycetia bacterium]|nr:sugar kinase [Planctomycetia bacterium]
GEMMIRIAPLGFLRFRQALPGTADLTFAGAEANVAVSIANLGGDARFITALPKNDIAEAGIATLRRFNVDANRIVRTDQGRLGIYFVETGANQRPSNVVYDREGSSIACTSSSAYDWELLLDGGDWFHTTGITPSLSRQAAESTLEAVKAAKRKGLNVSCDLNFRKKLWKWDSSLDARSLAKKTMTEILPYVDVLIANESDCADVLGIHAENTDTEKGKLDIARYPEVAQKVVRQFPNLQKVAITLRESISASHNNWGGMIYDAKTEKAFFAPLNEKGEYEPYPIRAIVDRVGGGDAFGAGLIFALTSEKYSSASDAIRFAVASSCLAHSIYGDFNFTSCSEVENLMKGNASGRVQR